MNKLLLCIHYLSVLIAIFALLYMIICIAELNAKMIFFSLIAFLLSLKIMELTEKYK